jgi:hypothetical protein
MIDNNVSNDFQPFLNKVLQMPQRFRTSVKHTFSSASLTFVLGQDIVPQHQMPDRYELHFTDPRTQTNHKEVQVLESNWIASVISIMYHMPLSTVVMHVPHVLDFVRRHQRLWRELVELVREFGVSV